MESEEKKKKSKENGLNEYEKVNLKVNPFWCEEEPPQTGNKKKYV